MSQKIQTRENHVRLDPAFHFFLMPLSFILFVWSSVHLFRVPSGPSASQAAGFLALLVLVLTTRNYSLRVQNRLIRLEERLRLQALGSDDLRSRIPQFTERQLIALRFASDAELPALANQALEENLDPKQIKASIRDWRADYLRV